MRRAGASDLCGSIPVISSSAADLVRAADRVPIGSTNGRSHVSKSIPVTSSTVALPSTISYRKPTALLEMTRRIPIGSRT
eukprot:2187129-Pyramimonas_sp.AAC.1